MIRNRKYGRAPVLQRLSRVHVDQTLVDQRFQKIMIMTVDVGTGVPEFSVAAQSHVQRSISLRHMPGTAFQSTPEWIRWDSPIVANYIHTVHRHGPDLPNFIFGDGHAQPFDLKHIRDPENWGIKSWNQN